MLAKAGDRIGAKQSVQHRKFSGLGGGGQGNGCCGQERERGSVEAGEWVEVERFNHLFGG